MDPNEALRLARQASEAMGKGNDADQAYFDALDSWLTKVHARRERTKQPVSVGDLVEYHGSLSFYEGIEFVVILVSQDERGYALVKADEYEDLHAVTLSNVHRDSFTVKEANYRV